MSIPKSDLSRRQLKHQLQPDDWNLKGPTYLLPSGFSSGLGTNERAEGKVLKKPAHRQAFIFTMWGCAAACRAIHEHTINRMLLLPCCHQAEIISSVLYLITYPLIFKDLHAHDTYYVPGKGLPVVANTFLYYLSQALQLTKLGLMLGALNGDIQVIQVTGCARCSWHRILFIASGFNCNCVGFSL